MTHMKSSAAVNEPLTRLANCCWESPMLKYPCTSTNGSPIDRALFPEYAKPSSRGFSPLLVVGSVAIRFHENRITLNVVLPKSHVSEPRRSCTVAPVVLLEGAKFDAPAGLTFLVWPVMYRTSTL